MLAETGPWGLASLCWLAIAAARALSRRIRAGDGLAVGGAAAATALAVIGQVHDVLYDTKVMYALWLALGVALAQRDTGRAIVIQSNTSSAESLDPRRTAH